MQAPLRFVCLCIISAISIVSNANGQEIVSNDSTNEPAKMVAEQALPIVVNASVPQSEIFEVSTRHLPERFRSISFDCPKVEVNRWVGNQWCRSSMDDALPPFDDGMLSILYVHGNFMERNNALNRVRIVDDYLRSQTNRSYRLIMLSWPSQRDRKPLRDVVVNNEVAECESLYVAWMLGRLRSHAQVSLLGFSFGAKAVTGGLHLDAGGTLPGYVAIPYEPNNSTHLYRLGLVAPAVDRQWLQTNGRHGLAFANVDGVMNLYNSRDPILRRFRFLDRFSQPIAAGFAGIETAFTPRVTSPLAGQTAIRQYDCGGVIGTTHSERNYYGECPYFREMIGYLLWEEPGATKSNACVSQ